MSQPWQGAFTALVTPFQADGALDEERLSGLVDFQLGSGTDGLVLLSATGEEAALREEERRLIVEIVQDQVQGRVPVMAGAFSGSTDGALELAKEMERLGVDAILAVVPSNSKLDREGILEHFLRIADGLRIPVVLSNLPAGTGSHLGSEVILRLAEHGNICGIDEASGHLELGMAVLSEGPDNFSVFSGKDELTLPMMALGGDGAFSVVSNEVPALVKQIVSEALAGHFAEARALHYRILGLVRANALETDPIPVKAALAMMGLIEESYRPPLARLAPEERQALRKELVKLQLVEEETRGSA